MYKNEREQEILGFLKNYTYLTVEFLSRKMNVSASSIRRDLTSMESRGLVKRSYGGVELNVSGNRTVPFEMRVHENASEKRKIAECASKLLHNGDVVFLDGSSSAYFMAHELIKLKNITVITNSIETMAYFTEYDIRAICTGGVSQPENRSSLVGELAVQTAERFYADFFFFSSQALFRDGRIFDCYEAEIPLRSAMMKNSAKSVFLCDKTKLCHHSPFFQCRADSLAYICSDAPLSEYFYKKPESTKLICCE